MTNNFLKSLLEGTGNVARHLQYQYYLQTFPIGSPEGLAGDTLAFVAPFQGYNKINFTKYGANRSCNALQLKITRAGAR